MYSVIMVLSTCSEVYFIKSSIVNIHFPSLQKHRMLEYTRLTTCVKREKWAAVGKAVSK
jgi:hypothetical protein